MKISSLLILIGTISFSGSAWAINAGTQAQPAWWISLILSAVLLVISGYVKGVKDDTKELRIDLRTVRESMLRDYHPKPEIREQFIEIKILLNELRRDLESRK